MADHPLRETARAAAAFAAYCALGPERSLERLVTPSQTEAKPRLRLATLKEWSSAFGWVARASAYDAEQRAKARATQDRADADRVRRKADRERRKEELRERMDDERAQLMRGEWARVLKRINDLLDSEQTRGLVGLTSLLKLALDEERLSLGSPTAITQTDVTSGGEAFDPASLIAAVQQRLARLAATSGAGSVPDEPVGG